MAEFSGKIIEVHYMDTEYSIVEVLYEGDGGKVYSYALRANSENKDYQDLLAEGWDTDKIIEETVAFKKAASAAWNLQVNAAAKILLKEKFGYTEEGESAANKDFSWDHFFDVMNTDKGEIFKFKIWAFESERMKDATAETKTKLRQAVTFIDAIKIYEAFL